MARQDDYRESFRLATDELKAGDLRELASGAGAEVVTQDGEGVRLRIGFLGSPVLVCVGNTVEVLREGSADPVSLPEQILICHYLLHAPVERESGKFITFREIPDGQFYYDAFQRRTRDPFLSTFGNRGDLFRRAALALGGKPVEGGDVAMLFRVFPHVPVHLVLWSGDDEFPPEAGILFDATLRDSLSAEDVAVMTGMLVYRLMGIARKIEVAATH